MRVLEVWRYPVKSLGGERVSAAIVEARGLELDRAWALVDREGGIASGKPTRRFRKVLGLMHHRSALADDGVPVVTLSDGRSARAGTPEADALVAEVAPAGFMLERENGTPHHDEAPVHLVSTRTLATLSELAGHSVAVQRLRPNLLLEVDDDAPFPEDGWIGRALRIGAVELEITHRTERCVMVTHAQAGVEPRPRLLQQIGRANQACAGVHARVVVPGEIREGDAVELL